MHTLSRFLAPFLAVLLVGPLTLLGCDAVDPAQTSTATLPTARAAAKTAVCHVTGSENNPYVLINVADAALPAHFAHGDARLGEAIPGMPGFVFDDACEPQESIADACIISQFDQHFDVDVNLATGEITGECLDVYDGNCDFIATSTPSPVGTVGDINGLEVLVANPAADQDAGGCDVPGLVDAFGASLTRTVDDSFGGTFTQFCDGAIVAGPFPVTVTLTAGACVVARPSGSDSPSGSESPSGSDSSFDLVERPQ